MSKNHKKVKTYSILVKGQVQGIGFRPFIYRVANKLKLRGYVRNTKAGVLIKAQGENWHKLINTLKVSPPKLAKISQINVKEHLDKSYPNFVILKSISDNSFNTVEIPADLAVCQDCVRDISSVKNRRYFYPFTNCTQCGPRYSIIYTLPYDRSNTTMAHFKMCPKCLSEYNNPLDRRFHAQPNACAVCGPQLLLYKPNQQSKPLPALRLKNKVDYSEEIIKTAQKLLGDGKILAIKSIGGFLLACDARNTKAVDKLRRRKNRPVKPFAIMCKDIKTVKKLCYVSNEEIKILKSKISPIVLLKKRPNADRILSEKIAPKNGYLGIMLPYTPLHHLLFYPIKSNLPNVSRETSQKNKKDLFKIDTLIMTSANLANEPIISDAKVISQKLKGVVDFILDNNREIESRCDDSVVFYFNNAPVIIRRSRGYVPEPIIIKALNLKPVLAFGADLKNHFALAYGNKVYYSPYIGYLSSSASIDFLMELIEKYQEWFNIQPEIVACDLHPDYISTRIAEEYARKYKLPLVRVQHHFAHLAGVMAENSLSESCIGIGFDGTGYGVDGNIWGGEILLLNYRDFQRIAHLEYMPLVGGDVVITNPKLLAKTYLNPPKKYNGLMTSSMGRLFDAVASILGVCSFQTFEGEAPIALENEALKSTAHLPFSKSDLFKNYGEIFLRPSEVLEQILTLKKKGISIPGLALHFHNTIVSATVSAIKQIIKEHKIYNICLSGGVFQNRIILTKTYTRLKKLKCNVFINRKVPINDGGIALGQAVIAGNN